MGRGGGGRGREIFSFEKDGDDGGARVFDKSFCSSIPLGEEKIHIANPISYI